MAIIITPHLSTLFRDLIPHQTAEKFYPQTLPINSKTEKLLEEWLFRLDPLAGESPYREHILPFLESILPHYPDFFDLISQDLYGLQLSNWVPA